MDNINTLIKHLESFGKLSKDDKKLIVNSIHSIDIKKGETFIKTGEIAHKIGFIISGVFRYFFYDMNGNEITSLFLKENQFVTNIVSFNELTPSSGTISSETSCTVVMIDRDSWDILSNKIPNWNIIFSNISNKALLEKTNFQRKIINQNALDSYLYFLETHPSIIQRVPLTHIASFLGVTKFSLSRIRNKIMAEKI